jgi:N-acetylneuraminate synthase
MSIMPVQIGNRCVGKGHPTFLVAEIGINHNGNVETAKALIDLAVEHRFDAVKFQKRTVEVVYSSEELARPRQSPFGDTNGDLKFGLELGEAEYTEIDGYCRERGILWFASAWDPLSVEFLERFDLPCYKVASPCLMDHELLRAVRSKGRPVVLSTGMSELQEVDAALTVLEGLPIVLLHCTSTYPSEEAEINLAVIEPLRQRYQRPVGYSGHEVSLMPSVFSVVGFEADMVERHITLSRAMWGTDQAASLEAHGMNLLSKYIRLWPVVKGDGRKRVYASELPTREKLRRVRT